MLQDVAYTSGGLPSFLMMWHVLHDGLFRLRNELETANMA